MPDLYYKEAPSKTEIEIGKTYQLGIFQVVIVENNQRAGFYNGHIIDNKTGQPQQSLIAIDGDKLTPLA